MEEPLLTPSDLPVLGGDERFTGIDASVLDFWRWALGDLRMNNARGYLAEFLVARAVKSNEVRRVEWGSHDVTAPDGTRIEVKSSAYLQSWAQRKISAPRFSLSGAREIWDEAKGAFVEPVGGRVDVWVFCLHTCKDHRLYDPLSVGQWRFWAAPNTIVEALEQKAGALSTIEGIAGAGVGWSELKQRITAAVAEQATGAPPN